MDQRDDYRFLKLIDALPAINMRVNLIGVIVEFGFPETSNGPDHFLSLKLVDETYSDEGLPVYFLAESLEKLPLVAAPGDIIQLSQVVMKTDDDGVYAMFNRKRSSFALYEGIYGKDFNPYNVSARFSPRDVDKNFLGNLRSWLLDFDVNIDPNDFQMISEMEEGRVSLVGKIVHVSKFAKDGWIIFLWDGTESPKQIIQSKLVDEMNTPLPLQLETEPLPRDVLCTFPHVGTILRVFVDERNKSLVHPNFKIGRWIGFLDIVCEVQAGLWRGTVMPFTKFQYVASNGCYALNCIRSYKERLSSGFSRLPWPWTYKSTFALTEVDLVEMPFSSLMDVITYQEATAKFKCIVRVVAILPVQVENFVSPEGTYRVRLTLEDPTARVFAYLYGEDAEKLFGGRPPIDDLRRKVKKLIGVGENDEITEAYYSMRNPPWTKCCLKSYYLRKDQPWESRQFRICNTRLIGG